MPGEGTIEAALTRVDSIGERASGRGTGSVTEKGGAVRYLIVVRPSGTGFEAWCPDLEGCVATGGTREEAERQLGRVIDFHVCALRRAGREPPRPGALPRFVELSGPRRVETAGGAA